MGTQEPKRRTERGSHSPRNGSGGASPSYQAWRLSVATVLVLVWAADNVRGIVDTSYHPHVAAAVPLAAATYIFGTVLWPRRKDGDAE